MFVVVLSVVPIKITPKEMNEKEKKTGIMREDL
jgi:hypothetical protein